MSQISSTPFLQGSRPRYDSSFLSGTQLADAVQSQPLQVFDVPATGAIQRSSLPNDMLEAFGLAGQVVGAAGNVAARDRAEVERLQEKEDYAQRGFANKAFSLDGVDLADDIENDRISLPTGAKPSEFATQFIDNWIETRYADRSEAWKEAYRENAPRIASALQNKRERDDKKKIAIAVDGQKDAVFRAESDEQLDAAIAGTKALGLDDRDTIASVVIPNLKAAAALGDTARYNRLASRIPGGMFAEDVAETKYRLEAAQLTQQTRQHQQADAMLRQMVDEGVPLDTVREAVDALNRGNQLAPGDADEWYTKIDNRAERNRREAVAEKSRAIVDAVRAGTPYLEQLDALATSDPDVYDRILPQIQRAEASTAIDKYYTSVQQTLSPDKPLASLKDQELKLPSGGVVLAKADDARKALATAEMRRIDQSVAADNKSIARAVWSRDNGVYPEEMADRHRAGFFAAGRLMQGGQPTQATMDALNEWKAIREHAPAWGRGLGDAASRRFFDAALDNMVAAGSDPAVALRMALDEAAATPEQTLARRVHLNTKMLRRAEQNDLEFDSNKAGYGQVLNSIHAAAEAKADYGMPPDKAIASAIAEAKESFVEINGAYIDTAVPSMTPDLKAALPAVTMDILTEYVGQSGRDPATLTLEPVGKTGLWLVKDGPLPARDPLGKFTFTGEKLQQRFIDMTAKRREKGKAGITESIMTLEQRRAEFDGADPRSRAAEKFNKNWNNRNK
jgi:hypothetical protein